MDKINPNWIDVVAHQPSFVIIKKSKIHQKGAFAKKKIRKNAFLGHYLGEIGPIHLTGPYIFHTVCQGQHFSIDASSLNQSNWTRYMNCSLSPSQENVTSYVLKQPQELEGYIVFYANRDIEKGEELMYDYGSQYKSKLNS